MVVSLFKILQIEYCQKMSSFSRSSSCQDLGMVSAPSAPGSHHRNSADELNPIFNANPALKADFQMLSTRLKRR